MPDWAVWLLVLVAIGLAIRFVRFDRPRTGSAAAGAVYDLLNEEKRNAIEIVVDGRAERRDGEHADDLVDGDSRAARQRDR